MTTQPAHCPVCHEPIAPSCTRSMASPVFYAGGIASFEGHGVVVSFHRCKCGAKTSMDSTTNATYAAPQANSICCPVCGKPINDSAIVTSYKLSNGLQIVLDGAPEDAGVPVDIDFQCECGAVVEVTDMNQDEDHLSLFGRAMSYTPACPKHGIHERFMHRGSRTIIWRENGKWFHNHELQFPDMTAEFATKTDLTGHATKFDARDACERAIRDLSNRLQTLIEGGIFGL